jgi:hypothetical protein
MWMLEELATRQLRKKRRDGERCKKKRRRKGGERERLSFCVHLAVIGISNE